MSLVPPRHQGPALLTLVGLGLLIGGWALIPPYIGPALDTAQRVEIVDHVVPGIFVLATSIGSLVVGRRRATGALAFLAGLGIILAGVWMTATHVPLVLQAARQEAPWVATVYHSLPGLAVLGLGAAWAYAFRDALVEPDEVEE